MAQPRLLTTGEAAKILGREAQTVRGMIKRGELRAITTPGGIRLLQASDVEALALRLAGKPTKWHPTKVEED